MALIKLIGFHEPGDEWAQIEDAIGEINTKDMMDYFELSTEESGFVLTESIGVDEEGEEWDAPTTDSEKIRRVKELIEIARNIPEELQAWAKQIKIYPEQIKKNKNIKIAIEKVNAVLSNKESRILNFNFTTVLEELYGVEEERICYIHGNNKEKNEKIYFGHGKERIDLRKINTLRKALPLMEQYYDEEGNLCVRLFFWRDR